MPYDVHQEKTYSQERSKVYDAAKKSVEKLKGQMLKSKPDDFRFEVTSSSLGLPQWWYSIWLPLLSLAILLRLLLAAVQASLQRHRT